MRPQVFEREPDDEVMKRKIDSTRRIESASRAWGWHVGADVGRACCRMPHQVERGGGGLGSCPSVAPPVPDPCGRRRLSSEREGAEVEELTDPLKTIDIPERPPWDKFTTPDQVLGVVFPRGAEQRCSSTSRRRAPL
eukprot:764831-Hanusia_phi.AAC.5